MTLSNIIPIYLYLKRYIMASCLDKSCNSIRRTAGELVRLEPQQTPLCTPTLHKHNRVVDARAIRSRVYSGEEVVTIASYC
jgi:hypothetical protein